jgi:hypothetical protein
MMYMNACTSDATDSRTQELAADELIEQGVNRNVTGLPDLGSDRLVAFVTSRLADEEYYANVAQSERPAPWQHQEHTGVMSAARDLFDCAGNPVGVIHGNDVADYLVRRDAARALREVEADRAILSAYQRSVQAAGHDLSNDLRQLLIARAAVWQDHPDYAAAVSA